MLFTSAAHHNTPAPPLQKLRLPPLSLRWMVGVLTVYRAGFVEFGGKIGEGGA